LALGQEQQQVGLPKFRDLPAELGGSGETLAD